MIGVRAGVKVGPRVGVAVGVSADRIAASAGGVDPMAGVTRDATSNIYVPATNAEWTTTMAAAGLAMGNPSALHLCQEAAGNLADSIGALTLAATLTPNYQQAVAGWSRSAVTFDDNTADSFNTSAAALPNLTTESMMVLAYVRFPAANPAAGRSILTLGTAGARASVNVTAAGLLESRSAGFTATGAAAHCDGTVRPVVLRVNRTASEQDGLTNLEKLSPAFGALAGESMLVGSGLLSAAAAGVLYMASFYLGAAEMTDAQIKTLLQTLGWTVSW